MIFNDDDQTAVGVAMNLPQKIAVVILNLTILTELSFSLYLASQDQANLTAIFLKCFFTMLIPTVIAAKVLIKRLGDRADARLTEK